MDNVEQELRCSKHPQYKAIYPPRSTTKHPGGYAECHEIYRQKNDIKDENQS